MRNSYRGGELGPGGQSLQVRDAGLKDAERGPAHVPCERLFILLGLGETNPALWTGARF